MNMEYIENHKFISFCVAFLIAFWFVQSAMVTNYFLNWTMDSAKLKTSKILLIWCLPPIPTFYWSHKHNIWFFGGGGGSGSDGDNYFGTSGSSGGESGGGDGGC